MEEILKSIRDEMKAKEVEFEKVKQDIETLKQNYTVALAKLEGRYEQIRGAYTALNDQYAKFANMGENTNKNSSNDTTEKEFKKEEVKEEVVEEKQIAETENVANLTKSQIEKIKQIVPNKKEENKKEEVPDYLKDEYRNA